MPVLSKVDTMVFTIMSAWPSARYWTRHSTELPGATLTPFQ
jgi:hypothetical protein